MFLFIKSSANQKTGNIAQTYTEASTCPIRCPFKGSGCYGEGYHTLRAWNRAMGAEEHPLDKSYCKDVASLRQAIETSGLPKGVLIRHNVAGDIAIPNTSAMDENLVELLDKTFEGYQAYTYTHCEPNKRSFMIARHTNMVINFSCETESEVSKVMQAGLPAVITITQMPKKAVYKTIYGDKVRVCPNQTHGVTCKECKLCARRNRPFAIAFVAHGSQASKAKKVIMIKKENAYEL